MSHEYRHFSHEKLLELREIHRTNLVDLELQAAQFGELNLTLPQRNQLRASHAAIVAIDAELRRRAGGTLPDPPELTEVRQKIALFASAVEESQRNGQDEVAQFHSLRLAELQAQEAALIRQRDDYPAVVREQAGTLATDLERGTVAYHDSLKRGRENRDRFVNRRRIKLDLTMFHDRVSEREQMSALLDHPAARVIQIVGTGGMGKTALACHALLTVEANGFAARTDGEQFRAVIYRSHSDKDIELTFEGLLRDIARACPEHAATVDEIQRTGDYAAQATALLDKLGEEPLLLALDNCETLMDDSGRISDPGIATLLHELMTPHHRWRAILTSRREVYVQADRALYARSVPLRSGLPFEDARLFLRDLDPDDRTGLQATPDAVLKPIVERLNGRPRLLQTFVALLKESTYTPVQLLARPDMLDRITEALHDWLTAGERAILRALAVFGAPAPREALEYMLLPAALGLDLDRTLARLSANGVISVSGGLFSLHSLDAEVALREESGTGNRQSGKAGSKELAVAALHRRAAEYFEQRELPKDQWKTIDDLAPQIARVEHLTAAGLCDDAAEVLRDIDFDYLLLWGYAQRLIALRKPLEGRLTQPQLQISQANRLGLCYKHIGKVREAIRYYDSGAAIAKQQRNRQAEGALLVNLGIAYTTLGELRRAITYYEQALVIVRKTGVRRSEGNALGSLGSAYKDLGEPRRAIDYYQQQLVIAREIGHRLGEGNALGNLGLAYANLGEPRRAIDYYQQHLVIAREIGHRLGEGITMLNIANAIVWQNNSQKIIDLYNNANTLFQETESPEGLSYVSIGLGTVAITQNDFLQARERSEAALALDHPQTAGKAAWLCGVVAVLQEQPNQALDYWRKSLEQCKKMGEVMEYRYLAGAVN
ncbi:MAG TPA: tetratricopeptide repeat protein, partial [Herpetosiphonaceae bacterium]|nr:tetratricopeptide repeat protein [Herpetosiphonaceae bacterium]